MSTLRLDLPVHTASAPRTGPGASGNVADRCGAAANGGSSAEELREHVREHAENRPGVYRMLGPGGQVIYVGKSVRVRTRLLSYFRADPGEKAAEIVGFTDRLDWGYQPSEFAALLREFRQIRRLRPPFNVQHKKERAVCFIRIPREPAGRVLVTTRPVDDGSEYFGPLLGVERVRQAVRVLVDVLELRDCPASTPLRFADQADLFGADYHPLCPRAAFHRCLAPCASGCTEQEYGTRLGLARAFLRGESDAPLLRLQRHLERAVERWLFEYASVVADRIEALRSVRHSLLRMTTALRQLTGIYAVPGHAGEDRLYVLDRGLVRADLAAASDRRSRRDVARRITRVLRSPRPPFPRLGGDGIAEILLVERWFRRRPEEMKRLVAP